MLIDADIKYYLSELTKVGTDIIEPAAKNVDSEARFPSEAFEALKELKLLAMQIPKEYGGLGFSVFDASLICEKIAYYCGSTALIFAMHQMHVICLMNHIENNTSFKFVLNEIASKQLLIASATSEIGVSGDIGSSICSLSQDGDKFSLEKNCPVVSYGDHSDLILITARNNSNAKNTEQVLILAERMECVFTETSKWNSLGFRGTCSSGYTILVNGRSEMVFIEKFSKILKVSMQPASHIFWSSVWLGIASSAAKIAHGKVIESIKKNLSVSDYQAKLFSIIDNKLTSFRAGVHQTIKEYENLLGNSESKNTDWRNFSSQVNSLKVTSSELLVEIVGEAMKLTGISSYLCESQESLCRHIRDAYGASLMISNHRLIDNNATLNIMKKFD